MSQAKFQLGLSVVLLGGAAWYAWQMASYPANAGRVPLIIALVAIGALVVQIGTQVRELRTPQPVPVAPGPPKAEDMTTDDPLATAEERVHELEEATEGYDVLLALDKVRRHRFIAIGAFSILFYVCALMVGFVVTTGVLITAFLLVARERLVTALVAGVVSAAAVYALVVLVLDLPALDGYLF